MTCPVVEIPRGTYDDDPPGACWIPVRAQDGKWCKPVIRCNCGEYTGIGLHHVHADGSVTASFFHSQVKEFTHKGKVYSHAPGCGWHVYLKLKGYDCGDFPPVD